MIYSIKQLENDINKNTLEGVYLLYGEETFILESMLKSMKKCFGILLPGINYIQVNDNNFLNLIDEIQTPAFGYEKKLILIRDISILSDTKKTKKNTEADNYLKKLDEYLKENIEYIKEKTLIIFVGADIKKTNSIYKLVNDYGNIIEFEKLTPNEITNRIKKICSLYEVSISPETLRYFVEICGTEMQVLLNEIRKLIEYAGKGNEIKKEDIDALSIKSIDSIIFDLTDNLGSKNIKDSIRILRELKINKEPVQKILITLYNHFRKLYLYKLAKKYNKDEKIALELKPNQLFLIYKYKKQAEYFTTDDLKKILLELINLDSSYKIGNLDLDIALEAILATHCS